MNFKIGDRVGDARDIDNFNLHDEPTFGEVVDLTSKGFVMVKWDRGWNKEPRGYDPADLRLESEVEAAQSVLEAKFREFESQIESKMKEAAQAVIDAAGLAEQAGVELRDMYEAYSPLYRAMDHAGWNTSSFNC